MVIFFAIDVGSKVWVRANLPHGYEADGPIIPDFLELTHTTNPGVSFSFMADWDETIRVPLLIGVSSLAVIGMLYYLFRYWDEQDRWSRWALIWIIPGAMGNLVDRVVYHGVTDFMHFLWFGKSLFVNNIADCFISVGVVFFVIATFFGYKEAASEEVVEKTS
jgi:signal peptidase II